MRDSFFLMVCVNIYRVERTGKLLRGSQFAFETWKELSTLQKRQQRQQMNEFKYIPFATFAKGFKFGQLA